MMAQRIERLVALGFVFSCFQAVHHALDATMLPMGGLSLFGCSSRWLLVFWNLAPRRTMHIGLVQGQQGQKLVEIG